jgi:hypothetical protein
MCPMLNPLLGSGTDGNVQNQIRGSAQVFTLTGAYRGYRRPGRIGEKAHACSNLNEDSAFNFNHLFFIPK